MSHYRKLAHRVIIAAGLGAFMASPAFADPGCKEMGGHDFHHEQHAKQMEQHHKQLHEALKLSAEQEPAWKKLMDSEQAVPHPGPAQNEDWSKLTTPERADKMLERAKAHQEHMSEHVAALKTFYAALTPAQQKTFEDFHAAPHDGMGGMRGKGKHRMPATDKTPAKP